MILIYLPIYPKNQRALMQKIIQSSKIGPTPIKPKTIMYFKTVEIFLNESKIAKKNEFQPAKKHKATSALLFYFILLYFLLLVFIFLFSSSFVSTLRYKKYIAF